MPVDMATDRGRVAVGCDMHATRRAAEAANANSLGIERFWGSECMRGICVSVMPNVRAKLTAEACVAWPRKKNSKPALERPSNACRSGSA